MNITYTNKEYELLIKQMAKRNINICSLVGSLILSVITFLLFLAIDTNYILNLVITITIFIGFYIFLKVFTRRCILKNNKTFNIVKLEQEIGDEYIKEICYRDNGKKYESVYKYGDILKYREDKYNFYLYLRTNLLIIVAKSKLENIKMFEDIIKKEIAN